MDFSESIKSIFKSSKSAIEKNNGTILLSHFGEMKPAFKELKGFLITILP